LKENKPCGSLQLERAAGKKIRFFSFFFDFFVTIGDGHSIIGHERPEQQVKTNNPQGGKK